MSSTSIFRILCAVILCAASTQASIIGMMDSTVDNPLTISVRQTSDKYLVKINKHEEVRAGIFLNRDQKLPKLEDLELHPGNGAERVGVGIWIPDFHASVDNQSTLGVGQVEEEFSLEEIFSARPEFVQRFKSGTLKLVFYFQTREDDHDPEHDGANATVVIGDFTEEWTEIYPTKKTADWTEHFLQFVQGFSGLFAY